MRSQPDNEKIIEILSETQVRLRGSLVALIEAGATPDTIQGFLELMRDIERVTCNLGDVQPRLQQGQIEPYARGEVRFVNQHEFTGNTVFDRVQPIEAKLAELAELSETRTQTIEERLASLEETGKSLHSAVSNITDKVWNRVE